MNAIHDLEHSNICRFFEWYETPKHIWSIKELCLGGTLARMKEEDLRLSENAVREFCLDIVDGLTFLHMNSVAMGDLCPEKVFYRIYIFKLMCRVGFMELNSIFLIYSWS